MDQNKDQKQGQQNPNQPGQTPNRDENVRGGQQGQGGAANRPVDPNQQGQEIPKREENR